jgi:formylglycine-generating enzyme required for sulfatase activity
MKSALVALPIAVFLWIALAAFAAAPGSKFRDCSACPEVIVIPAGSFVMGSPSSEVGRSESEGPQHRVRVQAFAAGIYPVTRDQYAAFVRETGRSSGDGCVVGNGKPITEKGSFVRDTSKSWRNPGYRQTGRDRPW